MTDTLAPSTMTAAIECTHLTKTYGQKEVLRNLSIALPQGAVIGLVGKNGSGKTTLLKAALGLIRPTSGRIATSATTHGLSRRRSKPALATCRRRSRSIRG